MNEIWQEALSWLQSLFALGSTLLVPGLILFLLLGQGRFDRDRIANAIECRGWNVLSIERVRRFFDSFSRQNGRRYAVVYQTHIGEIVRAECVTSLLSGTQWMSNVPFGGSLDGMDGVNDLPPVLPFKSNRGFALPGFAPRYRGGKKF